IWNSKSIFVACYDRLSESLKEQADTGVVRQHQSAITFDLKSEPRVWPSLSALTGVARAPMRHETSNRPGFGVPALRAHLPPFVLQVTAFVISHRRASKQPWARIVRRVEEGAQPPLQRQRINILRGRCG